MIGARFGRIYYLLFAILLYLPILLIIIFSFNAGTTLSFPLDGVTLDWYRALPQNREMMAATGNSLLVAVVSSLVATVIGGMAALGITRFNFPGKRLFLSLSILPLVVPSVVLGVALLLLFMRLGIPLSLWTVGIGHLVINVPYNMLIIAARLSDFPHAIEEASQDLGATYWQTVRRVTIPVTMPALVAAFLSSFTTSLDEFAVSFFLVGTDVTLPIYLYSQLRFPRRLPLVIALTAVIMLVSIIVVLVIERFQKSE